MNTEHKDVKANACTVCGETYLIVGDTPVSLAQHRPSYGEPKGKCPRCSR